MNEEKEETKRDDITSSNEINVAAAAAAVAKDVEDDDNNNNNNNEEEDDDFFELLSLRQNSIKNAPTSTGKNKRSKRISSNNKRKVKVSINAGVVKTDSGSNKDTSDTTTTTTALAPSDAAKDPTMAITTNNNNNNNNHIDIYDDCIYISNNNENENDDDDDDDDFLSFYKDTHEEQDPAYILRLQQQQQLHIQQQLQHVEALNVTARQEIETFISDLLTEKQASAERSVEAYKERAILEEKNMTNKLQMVYVQKTQSHQRKVAATVKFLQTRQQKEVANELKNHQQRHQQQQHQQQQHAAAVEWQQVQGQLQGKHQMQMAELHRKGNEVKLKLEADYKREMEKITKTRLLKFTEIEGKRQKLVQQFLTHFTSLRQRYLKRHYTKMQKHKQQVMLLVQQQQKQSSINDNNSMDNTNRSTTSTSTTTPREMAKSTMEDKEELRPPSPLKSIPDWIQEQQQQHQEQQQQQHHDQHHEHHYHHEEATASSASTSSLAGAAARHKHRKSVLSQTSRQLSVEIHNEGLWILAVSNNNSNNNNNDHSTATTMTTTSENNNDNLEQTFMCWGLRAFTFLESIVCGEIPNELQHFAFGIPKDANNNSNNNNSSNNNMTNAWNTQSMGGQIRCVVTDLRTSHETASSQRAVALRLEQEAAIQKLQQEAQECTNMASLAEKALKDAEAAEQQVISQLHAAMDNVQKAKRIQEEFNNKFRNFIGPDGSPLPTTNPNDRNELIKAMMRYKTNCENTANKEREARHALSDIKTQQVQLQVNAKNALKNATYMAGLLKRKKMIQESNNYGNSSSAANSNNNRLSEAVETERASTRVKDVIESFRKTAERRREQLNQKKSTSFSSAWIQSFPNLPMALKKSLWHKMHRRKQQIVLRPTGMVDELRSHVADVVMAQQAQKPPMMSSSSSSSEQTEAIEEEMLKAEQLYLLACHPPVDPDRSSVPPMKSSDPWAEPGWQLDLSVPGKRDTSDRILPCAPSFPLLEKNLSEMASAPGRQAANLMRPSLLRTLTVPLSAVAVASSPAEITTSLLRPRELTEGDPLLIRDDELKNGYTFSLKPPAPKIVAPSRRKAAPVGPNEDAVKPSAPAPKPAPSVTATSSATAATNESKQQKQPTKAQQKTSVAAAAAAAASDKPKPAQAKKRRSTAKSNDGPSKRKKESAASAKAAATSEAAAARSRKPSTASAQTSAPAATPLSQQHQQQQHLFQMQAAQQQQQALQAQQQQIQAAQQQQLQQQQQQQQHMQQSQPQTHTQTQQKPKQTQPKPRSQTQKQSKSQQQKQQKQQQQSRGQMQQQQQPSHHFQPQPQQRGQTQPQQPQQHIQQPQQLTHHAQQQQPQQPQQPQQHQQYAQQQQHHFPSPQQRQQMAQAQLRMMQQNAAAAAAAAARGGPQMSYSQAMAQMPQFYAQQAPHGQFQTGLSPMHLQGRGGMTYPGVVPMPGAANAAAAMAGQQPQGLPPMQGPPGNALGGPQQPPPQQQQQAQTGANPKDQNDPLFMLK